MQHLIDFIYNIYVTVGFQDHHNTHTELTHKSIKKTKDQAIFSYMDI